MTTLGVTRGGGNLGYFLFQHLGSLSTWHVTLNSDVRHLGAPNIIIGQTYCQKALIADVLTLETHHTGSFGIWLIVIRSKHLQACSIPFYIVSKHILVQEILTQNNLSHLSAYLGTAMTKLQSIPRNNKVYKGKVTQLQCIPRPVWPEKNRQKNLKFAQKWFH